MSTIEEQIQELRERQDKHELEERERFERVETTIANLPSKDDLKALATRKDVADVLRVFKAVSRAIDFTERGGKWGYRFLLGLAAVLAALSVILGAIKGGISGAIHSIHISP